jgi:hypothetical protein
MPYEKRIERESGEPDVQCVQAFLKNSLFYYAYYSVSHPLRYLPTPLHSIAHRQMLERHTGNSVLKPDEETYV